MSLFILTETSAGYALLKAKDKKLLKRDDLVEETETAEGVCGLSVCPALLLMSFTIAGRRIHPLINWRAG